MASRGAEVWLHNETLSVEFGDQPIWQFDVKYQLDGGHFGETTRPRLVETRYRSIQPRLWEIEESVWLRIFRIPGCAARRASAILAGPESLGRAER